MGTVADSVRVAQLPTVNYAALVENDPRETARLLSCCADEGFFYLDMQADPAFLQKVREVYGFMRTWFGQSEGDKTTNVQPNNYTDGYKPTGYFAGPYQNTRDCYESLKLSHRALGDVDNPLPEFFQTQRELFESYVQQSRAVTLQLLASLSNAMHLPTPERYENYHRTSQESNSTLVLLKYPYCTDPAESSLSSKPTLTTKIGHNKHTDIGSLTFLFTDQWGLQVLARESEEWEFIAPRSGHAVINVGDCLRFLSQKRLRSCLHRVIPMPGLQVDRYTIAYFLRPSNETAFLDSNGEHSSALTWHNRKYEVFKSDHESQRTDTILTGGLEPRGKPHELLQ